MDTLKDIWASLVAGVQERTTNPLSFSFIASWCLWNFKLIFILTGDGTTAERLTAVDALYPLTWSTYIGHALGAPLVTALLYVFVYPSISAMVIESYRKKQVAIANKVKEIEGNRLRTVEETARLTRDHETERTAWQEREARLQQQLQLTREALAASEKEAANMNSLEGPSSSKVTPQDAGVSTKKAPLNLPVKKATAVTGAEILLGMGSSGALKITESERDIIFLLSNTSHGLSAGQIARDTNRTHSVVKVSLDELTEKGLVQDFGSDRWELTPTGHRVAVKIST